MLAMLDMVIIVSAPRDIALHTATTLSRAESSADKFGSRESHHMGSRLISSCLRRSLFMFLTMLTWPRTYRTTCSADRTRQYATTSSWSGPRARWTSPAGRGHQLADAARDQRRGRPARDHRPVTSVPAGSHRPSPTRPRTSSRTRWKTSSPASTISATSGTPVAAGPRSCGSSPGCSWSSQGRPGPAVAARHRGEPDAGAVGRRWP